MFFSSINHKINPLRLTIHTRTEKCSQIYARVSCCMGKRRQYEPHLDRICAVFFSHGLGGFDALIAAATTGRETTLYTFNEERIRSAVSDL